MAEDKSEEAPEVEGEEGLEDESKGMKKILIILIPLILIGAGAGLYFTGTLDSLLGKKAEEGEVAADEKAKEGEEQKSTAVFVEIPDLIVNLQSSEQPHFLRLKVRLEVKNEEDATAVNEILPRVIDQFQTFLREMRMQDLRGSAGIYRLRQELLYRVNIAARPIEVQDVLFQEILVQ